MVGRTLSHYRILKKIGSGGMGEVYLAQDTKLDRKVALKVLPPELAESAERRRRFEREAKAVAALNHPNIVHVYSVEEADGVHFITMELVRGQTLSALIQSGRLPLSQLLDMAIPLADAVATAHEEGITHRDLKPDNVMMGDDGRIKILDFGLAKLKPETSAAGASERATVTATREGHAVGTLTYMSPEQAQGKSVDHRTDIFSLGVILYELATGRLPFRGDSDAAIYSSILRDAPAPVTEIDPRLPNLLGRIIQRCLAKDPEHRLQSAKDLRNELQELKQDVVSGIARLGADRAPAKRPRLLWVAAAAAALVVFARVAGFVPSLDLVGRDYGVFRLTNPIQVTMALGVEDYPTWSPRWDFARLSREFDRSLPGRQLGHLGDASRRPSGVEPYERVRRPQFAPGLVSGRAPDRVSFRPGRRWDLRDVTARGPAEKSGRLGSRERRRVVELSAMVGRWQQARVPRPERSRHLGHGFG